MYAAGVLFVLARHVAHHPDQATRRAGWKYLPFVLAVCAVFWVLNWDRFIVS